MLASNATENDNSFVTGKTINKINEPPAPEKEAFLVHRVNAEEDEEEEDT